MMPVIAFIGLLGMIFAGLMLGVAYQDARHRKGIFGSMETAIISVALALATTGLGVLALIGGLQ